MDKIKDALGDMILEKKYKEAKETIENKDKFHEFVQQLDNQLVNYPIYGENLNKLILMIDLVTTYEKGEYTNITVNGLVPIVAALLYWISSIDVIPDFIPVIGLWDDEAVLDQSIKQSREELLKFKLYRKKNPNEKGNQK